MSPSPIFPADRANLKAFSPVRQKIVLDIRISRCGNIWFSLPHTPCIFFFHHIQVLDIACADARAAYEKVKASRGPPVVSDVAGAPVSSIWIGT